MENNRFKINFFEFSFLVEACIPPRPIARTSFWHDVIDKYYDILTNDERNRLFDWICKNPSFQHSLELKNEDTEIFYARYNPENQYNITTNFNNKEKNYHCFKYNDKYYTKRNASIQEEYIIKIDKYEIS